MFYPTILSLTMLTLLQLGATHSQQLVTRNQLRKDIQAGVDVSQLLFLNHHNQASPPAGDTPSHPAASCREIDVPHTHYYPACTCAKGLSNRFCPSVSLSVSQSVCSENFWNQHIYYVKRLLYVAVTWQSKQKNVCVSDRDQSSSLLCISSSFLFNVGIVRHFDMVNHLDIWWRPGICWLQARVRVHQPPRSQDCKKLGWGLGTRQHIRLGAQVSCVILQATPFMASETSESCY